MWRLQRLFSYLSPSDHVIARKGCPTKTKLKNGQVAQKVSTDANGVFSIDVPPNGDYILEVSYSGCNSKRFSISTYNVTENIFNEKYNPSFSIGGFVMAKPFQGID